MTDKDPICVTCKRSLAMPVAEAVAHGLACESKTLTRKQPWSGNTCPECGGVLVMSEGCETCHSCYYSRCT